jgi:hypothetical protein
MDLYTGHLMLPIRLGTVSLHQRGGRGYYIYGSRGGWCVLKFYAQHFRAHSYAFVDSRCREQVDDEAEHLLPSATSCTVLGPVRMRRRM